MGAAGLRTVGAAPRSEVKGRPAPDVLLGRPSRKWLGGAAVYVL